MNIIKQKNRNVKTVSSLSSKDIYLKVRIRDCTKHDLEKLEWWGMFTEHRNIFLDQYNRHLQRKNRMLVAEMNNFPVGQVWIDFEKFGSNLTAVIWALRVHPVMQNMGIGTLLIKNSEEIITSFGYSFARIDVEKNNREAQHLYEKLGYRVISECEEKWSYKSPLGNIVEGSSALLNMKKALLGSELEN